MSQVPWCTDKSQERAQSIFKKYGVTGGDTWEYSDFNLVIGENGAGKSRLLCAIQEACQTAKVFSIYMDFTQISGVRPSSEAEGDGDKLSDPLLYHGALPWEAYGNFIPFLERDTAGFLQGLNDQQMAKSKTLNRRRQRINDFLQEQLGRKLIYDQGGQIALSSRDGVRPPLTLADAIGEMSPGERSILYFALGILCVESDSDTCQNFVLLLDEPENHLHPKALMSLIKEAKKICGGRGHCYTLVASHSVFLIPLFKFEELILIRNGKIDRPTAGVYASAYDVLIGDPSDDGGLQQMLGSISRWCFGDYLSQCLCPPTVSGRAKADDPEFKKLVQALDPLVSSGKPIRLLDYGGGSGRIAKCMQLRFWENPKDPLIERLLYDIYDPHLISEEDLPDEPWMKRRFDGKKGNSPPPKSYDLVVLFNVLHEVDVTKWADTLNYIFDLMNEHGVLVFGERMVLSQGERPYGKSGYLVLRQKELSALFGDHNVEELLLGEDRKDPTICCVIRPSGVQVTKTNITEAIKALQTRSWKMIHDSIDNRTDARQAREYAFYCQQYINTEHALGLLAKEPPIKAMTLNQILNQYNGARRLQLLVERSRIQDDEGIKCLKWLEHN